MILARMCSGCLFSLILVPEDENPDLFRIIYFVQSKMAIMTFLITLIILYESGYNKLLEYVIKCDKFSDKLLVSVIMYNIPHEHVVDNVYLGSYESLELSFLQIGKIV